MGLLNENMISIPNIPTNLYYLFLAMAGLAITKNIFEKHAITSSRTTRVLVFIGNIGAGKSTCMTALKESFSGSMAFYQEPVDEWLGSLNMFYSDPERYTFMFQMHTLLSRLNILKRAFASKTPLIGVERCLATDKHIFADPLYKAGKMNDEEYNIYCQWHQHCMLSMPDAEDMFYIYLQATPEVCFERIQHRNRKGETQITIDYLETCTQVHKDMMDRIPSTNKLIIDANGDLDLDTIREYIVKIGNESPK